MGIKIKTTNVLKLIIFYSIVVGVGQYLFKLPYSFYYLNDFLLIVAVMACITYLRYMKRLVLPKSVTITFILLLLTTILSFVFNIYNPLYYLWGARNTFRSFFYFFCCCMCLTREDAYDICDFLVKLVPLNIVLCTIQYYMAINSSDSSIVQFAGDHVGGIFGNEVSCNRILNIYVIFIFCWAITKYLKKDISGMQFLMTFLSCAYMSILAELKVVVLEIACVVPVLIQLISKRTNKILSLAFVLIGMFVFLNVWSMFNSDFAKIFSSLESVINYSSASSYGKNSLNRLTVIPRMYETFMDGDVVKTLFGIGLGNADSSGFAFLTTPIYLKYGYLKYNLFQSGFLFLEIGTVGLLMYIAFFGVSFLSFLKYQKMAKNVDTLVYVGGVFNIIAVVCLFYNTSLRSEVSNYLCFFILSLPYIWSRTANDEDLNEIPEKAVQKGRQRRKKLKIKF